MATLTDTDSKQEQPTPADTQVDPLASLREQISDWGKWKQELLERKGTSSLRKLLSPHALAWGLDLRTVDVGLATQLFDLRKRPSKAAPVKVAKGKRGLAKSDVVVEPDWNATAESWLGELATRVGSTPSSVSDEVNAVQNETHDASQTAQTGTQPLPGKVAFGGNEQQVIEALAWCHAAPSLLTRLSPELWNELTATLLAISLEAQHGGEQLAGLPKFWLQCELPMSLAFGLPTVKACFEQRHVARSSFAEAIEALTDGEGMPRAGDLAWIHGLMASCTRILVMDGELRKGRISSESRLHVEWLFRQTLRWSRPDGSTILGPPGAVALFEEFMTAAVAVTKDQSDRLALMAMIGKRRSVGVDAMADPSEHSEWSELATLRCGWHSESPRLALDFSNRQLRLELALGRHLLLTGKSLPEIVVDNVPLTATDDWEEVCWESDADVDYIELELPLSDGWRLQRQVLLAREDEFAFMADAVLGPEAKLVHYSQPLSLAPGVTLVQAEDTCEASICVAGFKKVATLIPPSLPEWRSELRDSRLRPDSGTMEIEARAAAVYAPLFVDLAPHRLRKALTWRQLTVAENLQILSPQIAVAYRIQVGSQQWVFYRSLAKNGNRTFLGLNVVSEFLAARFQSNGEIESLIEITG